METFSGVARDAKLGAVVVLDDGGALYIDGLGSWPPEIHGRRVEVTGTVRTKKLAPDPVVDEKGAVSAGAFGSSQVIEGAAWRVLP